MALYWPLKNCGFIIDNVKFLNIYFPVMVFLQWNSRTCALIPAKFFSEKNTASGCHLLTQAAEYALNILSTVLTPYSNLNYGKLLSPEFLGHSGRRKFCDCFW
jgi:hypothetical protein